MPLLGNLLQRAEAVSKVGGFMLDFATGELQWTPQTYRIHEVDETRPVTVGLAESFLSAQVRARLQEATRLARESGIGYDLQVPMITARKRTIWIRMTAEVECENGVPARIVGAIQDVTDRCTLEQRLRDALSAADKASKSKSEFLANMSHEIRTPLNAVIGLGYLLEQTPLSEEQRQFLAKIQFAGRALLGVINNVLDLSKIEADEMSLEDEPFDLPELVRDVSQMLLPQAVEKRIELKVDPAASLPGRVFGDASRVRQILTNLLNNAIKFTERGHVRLAVFCTEQGSGRIRLRCEVEDTGIGIERAACERLFTPFTQADASTTRRFGGTGLGLSIARRFVELMGGEIGVASTVAVGSTFWIEIPLRVAPEVNGALTNALRVLIFDPKGDTPQGLGAMVRALGWIPLLVATGEELQRLMEANGAAAPDALIFDLHGSDSEAHGLIAALASGRENRELPPVIVVANSPQSYLEHKQKMREGDVLLVRPVSSSALFNAINLAVSRQSESCDRVFESTNFDELHARWLSGVRVLVVDDSDINREVAQRILVNQGARVTTCSDGLAALAHLQEASGETDVVLMDVQMPNLDGNEAARRIRTRIECARTHRGVDRGRLGRGAAALARRGDGRFREQTLRSAGPDQKVRRLVEIRRGEPIPMVFDDATSAGCQGAPFMKSIDAGVVQQMFGDDMALFKSLLSRLLREYAQFAVAAAVPVGDEPASLQLKARVHKLKGSAGMIGATNIMRLAGAAERALQDGRSADAVEGILKRLAAALTALREEAEQHLADQSRPVSLGGHADAASVPVASPPARADLAELCELLESQNLDAVEKFERMAASLRGVLDAERFADLHDAVKNLDFQMGAELLRRVFARPM